MKDIVFEICAAMLRNSPERSYKRLNPALRNTLANCIEADLPFQKDTFRRISNELRGGWWFGDGSGSATGEGFYTLACEVNHASAQQSFEAYAGRPGVLWEENIGTPSRLHVGAKFTWKGQQLTVTSMREDSLVACSYKGYNYPDWGIKVGALVSYRPQYVVTSSKRKGASAVLTVAEVKEPGGQSIIAKRLTIKYSEITELRRSCKARVKAMVEKIAACDPVKDAAKLTKEINGEHFRHFELEEIQAAFQKRREWMSDADKIRAWRNGGGGAWMDSKSVLLRVLGDRIECSNGNSISRVSGAAVLPILLAHRKREGALSLPVESYNVERVTHKGVKIGCTLVPWPEIELIAPQLQAA